NMCSYQGIQEESGNVLKYQSEFIKIKKFNGELINIGSCRGPPAMPSRTTRGPRTPGSKHLVYCIKRIKTVFYVHMYCTFSYNYIDGAIHTIYTHLFTD